MKIIRLIWEYLKDWKNWVTHTLTGIAILLVALYLPVKLVYRMAILLLVVVFNVVRMKRAKKK